MSEQTSQEPTMEEILASIRRIISEDEPGAEGEAEAAAPATEAAPPPAPEPESEPAPVVAEAPPPAPEPEPVAAAAARAPEPEEDDDDDALELTQKVETLGDLDVVASEPTPAPAPPPMAAPVPEAALVSAPVAMAAASAFGQLSAAIGMPRSDRTLEDVVRELLQPLLKQWLDENLPKIVQEAVEAEVERISRARVR